MVGKFRLTDEERLERKRAKTRRANALVRLGDIHIGEHSPLDEGSDPLPMTQRGENRLRFNLGDGCRMRPRHHT